MKTFIAIVLVAILGAVLFGVTEQHQNSERERRERAEQALDACWKNAATYGGAGADVCKRLADSLNK